MSVQDGILDAILEQVPSAIFILNARGHVIRSNLAKTPNKGLDPEPHRPLAEQVGRYRSREPLTGRGLRPQEAPSALVMAGQVIQHAEILVWNAERQQDMWLNVTGRPVFDNRGAINGAVMVYSDVTSERVLARDLETTARAHARLLAEIYEGGPRRGWMTHPLVEHAVRQSRGASIDALSPREMEILRLLVQGLTNREIGNALHLSAGTVRNYVGGLLTKLNAHSRTQAAVLAVMRTLLNGS
jgi:DNA-binding CsgD family transcriptional regulator